MARLLQFIFVVCLIALPVAWLKTDTLPKVLSFSHALATEPRQQAIEKPPIDVEMGGVSYRVEPAYHYALDGMVVSYRIHDGDYMLHRLVERPSQRSRHLCGVGR